MMADRKNLRNYRKHDTFCSSCSFELDIVFLGFFSSLPRRMRISLASSGSPLMIDSTGYVVNRERTALVGIERDYVTSS
jgi:hypothetical protein